MPLLLSSFPVLRRSFPSSSVSRGQASVPLTMLLRRFPLSSCGLSWQSLERAVAKRAMELVKPGMVIGLGSGSTASMAIEELGKLVQQGKLKDVLGVGASYQSHILARQFGVKTVDLNDVYIHPSAKVHPTAKIGPNVSISANAQAW